MTRKTTNTLFASAWRLARQGARRYGGRASVFFRCALVIIIRERKRVGFAMKVSEVISQTAKPAKATLVKIGKGNLYHVIGASGFPAGWLERVRGGWTLTLKATPTEVFRQFRDARAEALHAGRRY